MREVAIRDEVIRLGQLLKLAGVVDAGGDVKQLLDDGQVTVNGVTEPRRGRQLHRGEVVGVAGDEIRLA